MLGEALLLNGQTAEGQALLVGVNNAQGQLGARAYWYGSLQEDGPSAVLGAFSSGGR
jgi:hypothetical protein